MKDVYTSETTETKHKSTSTSLLAVDSEIRLKMKNASTCITTETKNQSTSTSFFLSDSKIQGQMEDSTFSVSIEGSSVSTSVRDIPIEAKYKTFIEIVRETPYDEKTEIILFEKNLCDPKLSSNMVSLITALKEMWNLSLTFAFVWR